MNTKVLKRYLLLLFVSLLLFVVFIVIEKSNYAVKLSDDKNLSQQSIGIIKGLTGENAVKFEIYSNKGTFIAKKLFNFFKPIKQLNNAIKIEFIDRSTNPSKVKQNNVTMQGEIVLTYKDESRLNKINITELSESAIINAILRLQNDKDEFLLFAEGYGMKTVADEKETGLLELLMHLRKIGVRVARKPLNISLVLPDSVKVIVLPNPTETLDEHIVYWLQQQADNGISIWWLHDVAVAKQPYLELAFDTILGKKKTINGKEYSATLSNFPQHPIVEHFNQPIYLAEAIEVNTDASQTFIQTSNNEPLAISKQLKTSRLVITGDANFITNQYINVAANKSLTIRIVDWLFKHDDRINIPVKVSQNTQLLLSKTQLVLFSFILLILIPLLFIGIAIKQWRSNRV